MGGQLLNDGALTIPLSVDGTLLLRSEAIIDVAQRAIKIFILKIVYVFPFT